MTAKVNKQTNRIQSSVCILIVACITIYGKRGDVYLEATKNKRTNDGSKIKIGIVETKNKI